MSVLARGGGGRGAGARGARGAPSPGPERFAGALEDRAAQFVLEAVYEGYLLHYGTRARSPAWTPTCGCWPATPSTRSASPRLAASGDVAAVAELSDLISLSAQAQARRAARELAEAALGRQRRRPSRRSGDRRRAGPATGCRPSTRSPSGRAKRAVPPPCWHYPSRAIEPSQRGRPSQARQEVPLHRGPRHRRRLRGRDRHPPALHGGQRARGGRHRRRRRSPSRRSASRSGPMFEDITPRELAVRRPRGGLQRADLRPAGDQHRRRTSAIRARPRSTCAASTRPATAPATRTSPTSRSPRAAPTSAAPCATSRRRRSSSARATAASTTSRARSQGGPPVRPLDRFYTRVRAGRVRDRRPLLAELRARALLAA